MPAKNAPLFGAAQQEQLARDIEAFNRDCDAFMQRQRSMRSMLPELATRKKDLEQRIQKAKQQDPHCEYRLTENAQHIEDLHSQFLGDSHNQQSSRGNGFSRTVAFIVGICVIGATLLGALGIGPIVAVGLTLAAITVISAVGWGLMKLASCFQGGRTVTAERSGHNSADFVNQNGAHYGYSNGSAPQVHARSAMETSPLQASLMGDEEARTIANNNYPFH